MAFYNSLDWYKLRDEVLKRDEYHCQKCGIVFDTKKMAKMFLVVHHVKPRSEGGEDKLDNLQTLCFRCHNDHHSHLGGSSYAHRMQQWIDCNANEHSWHEPVIVE